MIASIQGRLSLYTDDEEDYCFDRFKEISAMDQDEMRRAGAVIMDYEFSITSHLFKEDVGRAGRGRCHHDLLCLVGSKL